VDVSTNANWILSLDVIVGISSVTVFIPSARLVGDTSSPEAVSTVAPVPAALTAIIL
jgi:hypothetical protein